MSDYVSNFMYNMDLILTPFQQQEPFLHGHTYKFYEDRFQHLLAIRKDTLQKRFWLPFSEIGLHNLTETYNKMNDKSLD